MSVVLASTFTAESVLQALTYCLRTVGISATFTVSATYQIVQDLLDPTSALSSNAHGVNVVLIRPDDWIDEQGASITIGEMAEHFIDAVQTCASRITASWIVVCCPPSSSVPRTTDFLERWQDVVHRIEGECVRILGLHVLRAETVFRDFGVVEYHDPEADRLGRVPYKRGAFGALGAAIARTVHALRVPPRKVIVIDCDHTLWRGACAEDGAASLIVDQPRRHLQEFVAAQIAAGALLCLCSKNDVADVWRAFDERPEMVLSRDSFVSWRINWKPKSENLRSLAKELQLGLDTFIFIDDDPRECAEVRTQLPEVLTIQLPSDPAEIPDLLQHVWAFDRLTVTAADRERTQQYHLRRDRDALRRRVGTVEEFVRLLDLRVRVAPASDSELSRIAQLTYRTNQFNCTLKRWSERELMAARLLSDHDLLGVYASDRLGDYGLVGAIILREHGDEVRVDTLLLSCRALGRGIESRMLASVEAHARDRLAAAVVLPFVPGPRNHLAKTFLDALPLPWLNGDGLDGRREYRLWLS